MKVTEGTPNQKINLRFAEGGVLVHEEEPESVGPANIMDGRDTGSGGAVELDRSQVKAIAKNFSSLSHSDEWPPGPMKTVWPLVLCAREGGAAGFAAIDAGFNCSIFGDLPIA